MSSVIAIAAAVGATLALMVSGAAAQTPRIEEGRPFPDLILPSMADGSPMSLADFRGKKVVLHVFASW